MKKFRWKIEFKYVRKEKLPDDVKDHFEGVWMTALQKAYKDGIGLKLQKTVFKISQKLVDTKDDFLELEDAEFELIKEPFEKAKFDPRFARLLTEIYENIDGASDVK